MKGILSFTCRLFPERRSQNLYVSGNRVNAVCGPAQEIGRVLRSVEGAHAVQVLSPPGMPPLSLRLRRAHVQRWGLDRLDVLDLIRSAYQGDVVGQSYEGNRSF